MITPKTRVVAVSSSWCDAPNDPSSFGSTRGAANRHQTTRGYSPKGNDKETSLCGGCQCRISNVRRRQRTGGKDRFAWRRRASRQNLPFLPCSVLSPCAHNHQEGTLLTRFLVQSSLRIHSRSRSFVLSITCSLHLPP